MESDEAPPSRARWVRVIVLLVIVIVVVVLFATGAFDGFSLERTASLIRSFGPWGAIVYLAAFTFVQPVGLSGHTFAIAASLVWPPPVAFALALAGALGSSLVSFAFARYVAFDWVRARIPARMRKHERLLTDRGLFGVVIYRLFTFTFHPAQLLIGVVDVPVSRLIAGTLIGFAPTVAVDVLLGGELLRWIAAQLGMG